jgi:hypothetical protein
MLVYNIKRSINILGVSDLIAKLKNGTHPTKQSLFCLYNELFGFIKIVLKISYNLLPKQLALERLYCRLEYVLFVKLSEKEVFHSLTFCHFEMAEFVTAQFSF